MLQRMGDDIQLKTAAVYRVYREADAIHADRALLRDVARQRMRCRYFETDRSTILLPAQHLTYPVDVPADQMTAQWGTQGQRFFQVQPGTGPK